MEFKIGDKVTLTYDGFSDLSAGEHFIVVKTDSNYLDVRSLGRGILYRGIFPRRFKPMSNIRRH